MRIVEHVGRAEHRARGVLPHLDRVVEMLDPDFPEDRMIVRGDVARREDTGMRGLEGRSDTDPPVRRDRLR